MSNKPDIGKIVSAVAEHFNISAEDLTTKKAGLPQQSRATAVLVAADYGYTYEEISEALGYRDKKQVSAVWVKANQRERSRTHALHEHVPRVKRIIKDEQTKQDPANPACE